MNVARWLVLVFTALALLVSCQAEPEEPNALDEASATPSPTSVTEDSDLLTVPYVDGMPLKKAYAVIEKAGFDAVVQNGNICRGYWNRCPALIEPPRVVLVAKQRPIGTSEGAMGARVELTARWEEGVDPDCWRGGYFSPVVRLTPNAGRVGERIELRGKCFRGREKNLDDRLGYFGLIGTLNDCELIAGVDRDLADVTIRKGRMRGYFTVPSEGGCFQTEITRPITPHRYGFLWGCHACTVAHFTVTE